jgi:hypothetical protein
MHAGIAVGHVMPQPPQSIGSVTMSEQVPLQFVFPCAWQES